MSEIAKLPVSELFRENDALSLHAGQLVHQ